MSATDYPVPSFAAYVWLAGDKLCLGLPPSEGHQRGHTVIIPLAKLATSRGQSEWEQEKGLVDLTRSQATVGFATLLQVLTQRERDGRVSPIGYRGEPTQHNIEAIIRALSSRHATTSKAEPLRKAESLADLGLD